MSRILFSFLLVLTLTVQAQAVDIIVKFPEANAKVTVARDGTKTINWRPAILAAIKEIQMMNAGIPALKGDPIPVNPSAVQIESLMGDVMSPPNEYGYSTVRISKWRKLIIPPGVAPTKFSFVFGVPVEDKQVGTDKEGKPIYETVYGGRIAE